MIKLHTDKVVRTAAVVDVACETVMDVIAAQATG
jgi:hypothetical protein